MTTATAFTFDPATDFILDKIGFVPTGPEQAAILRSRKRFKLVVGGEQAGKSVTASVDWAIHLAEDKAAHPGEPLLYWLVAMDYIRTTAEFNYIKEELLKLGLKITDESKRVDPGYIECSYPGNPPIKVRVETKSGKDPRTISMFAPNGIIGCEASQLDLLTYQKCLARLAPKNGWLHLAGTLEGRFGWYPALARAWAHGGKDEQSFQLPSITNHHFYPGGLQNEKLVRLRRETSDDFFNERIMGIAAPPRGIVFGEFRPDIHIRDLAYDPELPVHISEDPGYAHAHAIEVWQVHKGGQIHVVDEIFERGIITDNMIDICMRREWWKNPHKTLVIDPNYANQHQAGHSIAEIWLAKTGLANFGEKVKVAECIERLKSFLKVDALSGAPGIVFDRRCKGILSEFGAYQNPFDDQEHVYSYKIDSEGNIVGDEPVPLWNDGLSALMYGIVEWAGLVNTGALTEFTVTTYGPKRENRDRLRRYVPRYARR